jgi:DNA-binding beta-propeller fold protein YncE
MDVYDIDHNFSLLQHVSLPTLTGGRGIAFSLPTHLLYIAYGSDSSSGGSLLAYNLAAGKIAWIKNYTHGIDSMAITPDGKTIYMPAGENSGSSLWYVENASTGDDIGTIQTDLGPHDTVVSVNGSHVYMGPRNLNDTPTDLYVADTTTNQITQKVGPFLKGVRPFTINREETLVYASTTGFLGFQVGSITTGKILYTVPIQGFSCRSNGASDPSHGISLSPDEKELYVIDSPCGYVHVFDVSSVPQSQPKQVADIKLAHPLEGAEQECAYDCLKDGWLQHSVDGRYVFVGDSGDVIDTATRKPVAFLPSLANTRKMIEIDWQNHVPVATSERQGLGYATHSARINVASSYAAIFILFDVNDQNKTRTCRCLPHAIPFQGR